MCLKVLFWAWLFWILFFGLLALFGGNWVYGFKLVSMDFEAIFGLGLGSYLKYKGVDFISEFGFLHRNWLDPVLLRFPLKPGPGVTLLDNPERITHVRNPIQYLDILCRINTVDVHPGFTNNMRFLCLYILVYDFSLNRFAVSWIMVLFLGLVALLLPHVQGFEKPSVHILYVLGALSLVTAVWEDFFELFMGEFHSFGKMVFVVFLFIGLEERFFFGFAHGWKEFVFGWGADAEMRGIRLGEGFKASVKSDSIFVFHLYFYWLN